MSFSPGDKVLVNKALEATILSYAPEANLVMFEAPLPGGATSTYTAHISNTEIELVEAGKHEAQDELPLDGQSE